MNSIWTDLLFLHGHLVRKEDLVWQHDQCLQNASHETAGSNRSCATDCPSPERRKLHWPHFSAPR